MASILIVHSFDAGERYAEWIRAQGYAAHRVHTPEEAFAYIEKHPPAVIVTDLHFRMSAFNGRTFVEAVRQLESCSRSGIVVISGRSSPEHRRHLRLTGADLFLGPTDLRELSRHLTRALSEHRRGRRPRWRWPDDVTAES